MAALTGLLDRARMWDRLSELRWSLPLATYRISGRRLNPSPQLYRAGIPWQRRHRRDLPGMTSPSERAYFKWHAQEVFAGHGAVVDLGSWFGSTTATLAMGLQANPRRTARTASIHAFDRFIWEEWMDAYADLARFGPYRDGDSFLREFKHTIRPWADRVQVHAGDLCGQTWLGTPVEVLLVDAMKAWDVAEHIASQFFGPLLEGRAHVIHQDFSNCYTPWIHLLTYRLREHLIPVQDVADSETVAFRLVRSLAGAADELRVKRDSFDGGEVQKAFAHSLRITRAEKHSGIRAARVMLDIYDGDLPQAEQRFRRYVDRGELSDFHEAVVRNELERAPAVR